MTKKEILNYVKDATATITGKTISGASNTFSNIAQSAITNLTDDLAGKFSDGGNALSAAGVFGTSNNHGVSFITNGVERMVIGESTGLGGARTVGVGNYARNDPSMNNSTMIIYDRQDYNATIMGPNHWVGLDVFQEVGKTHGTGLEDDAIFAFAAETRIKANNAINWSGYYGHQAGRFSNFSDPSSTGLVSKGFSVIGTAHLEGATFTNQYKFYAENPYMPLGSKIVNNIGVYIEPMTGGSGANYNIFSEGTSSLNIFEGIITSVSNPDSDSKFYALLDDTRTYIKAEKRVSHTTGLTYGFQAQSTLGVANFAIDSYFDATGAALISSTAPGGIIFSGNNNDNHLLINSSGFLYASEYGDGVVTGTATYGAAFDANGKLIEVALGGGGGGSDVFTKTLAADGSNNNVQITSTSSGSTASIYQVGLYTQLLPGYTGNGGTISGQFNNTTAGTGTDPYSNEFANFALLAQSVATTTGTNVGAKNKAGGGDVNFANLSTATTNKNLAVNHGVVGLARNTGTSSEEIAGYFGLGTSVPSVSSAALIADNQSTGKAIFYAMDNSNAVFGILGGGTIKIYNSTAPGTPSGGGYLYVESGALKYKGSSGTVTTLGNA